MALAPAVTDVAQLQERPVVAALLAWNRSAVQEVKLDRDELSIYLTRESLRSAFQHLRSKGLFNFLSDLTCADFHPREPRFEMAYHLLSHARKERFRLKARLDGSDAVLESLTPIWPAANFYEREVFDLFGIHFLGHPDPRRIMLPDDWKVLPLRRDYPVEVYR